MKHGGIDGIIESGKAPGLMGLNKGPNMRMSGRKQFCFNQPDAVAEFERDMRTMEDGGKMTAVEKARGLKTLESLRGERVRGEHESVDYGEEGHPLEVD